MSGKINKKSKGTNQQPPDDSMEKLARELFKNTTPKSDKKKNKKKTGVGKSSESVKGLGGLREDNANLDSEIESVDSVSLSEDQDESKSEQSESDRGIKRAGLAAPFREWDGIGTLEKIRVKIGDRHKFQVSISQLVALAIIEDEALGLVFLEDSGELECGPVAVARLDLCCYLVDVDSFQCFASGFDEIKECLAANAEALDFLGVSIGGLTVDSR